MKLTGFADIDFFIQQLAVLKNGTAVEKSVAVSGLRRILSHVKQFATENKIVLELSYLERSETACNGWEGMAASDEYYDCATSTQSKVGVSVIVRNHINNVIRSAVFALSTSLAHEIFGNSNCMIELGILPVDPSILDEENIVKVTTPEKVEEKSTEKQEEVPDDNSSSSEGKTKETTPEEKTETKSEKESSEVENSSPEKVKNSKPTNPTVVIGKNNK